LRIRGIEVAYDNNDKELTCGKEGTQVDFNHTEKDQKPGTASAKLEPIGGHIRLRILVDKIFIEIFANNGEVYMPVGAIPDDGQPKTLELFTEGGAARVRSLTVRELESVW